MPLAGILDQIEHLLKTCRAAVVRVWHHRAFMGQAELGQAPDFALVFRGAYLLHQGQIVPVHHQNQIMCLKVSIPDLARPQVGQVVPTQTGVLL